MCIHATLLKKEPYHAKLIDTCYYCAHLGTTITERLTPFTKPLLPSQQIIDNASLPYMEWEEEEKYKAALDAKYGKGPLAWEYGKGDWKRLREQNIADLQGLRPARLRAVKNFWEDEQGPSEFTESREAVLPEVLSLFQKSGSRLWLRAMYDSVFPENTERLEEDARREKFNRRNLAQHRRIWDSIALGKVTQTKHAYQDPKPTPLLHTIYSAPKTERTFMRWTGTSKFSDLASAEDRAQCYPTDFSITHVSGFSVYQQYVSPMGRQYSEVPSANVLTHRTHDEGSGPD